MHRKIAPRDTSLKAVGWAWTLWVGRGLGDHAAAHPHFIHMSATWTGWCAELGPEPHTLLSSIQTGDKPYLSKYHVTRIWVFFSHRSYCSGICSTHANIISNRPPWSSLSDGKQDFARAEGLCTHPPHASQLTWENKHIFQRHSH